MSLKWLENPGRKRKRRKAKRRARRNGPELVVYGNPRKRKKTKKRIRVRRKKPMAKRKRRRKTRRKARKVSRRRSTKRRRRTTKRRKTRRGKRRARKSVALRSVRTRGSRNPRSMLKKWVPLPTVQELLWVGAGTLGIPTFNKFVTNLIPIDAIKGGWGNIVSEFVIGSIASSMAKRYAGATAGDVLSILVLARAIGRAAHQVNPNLGFATGGDELGYYTEGQMNYMDPALGYVSPGVKTGFAAAQVENSLPTMV